MTRKQEIGWISVLLIGVAVLVFWKSCASTVRAQAGLRSPSFVASLNPRAGVSFTPDLIETFDTTSPNGTNGNGYDLAWAEGGPGTAPNEDYTTTILQGTESLEWENVGNTSWASLDLRGTTHTNRHFERLLLRVNSTTQLSDFTIWSMTESNVGDTASIKLTTTNTLVATHGSVAHSSTNALAQNTIYYVWLEYQYNVSGQSTGIITAAYSTSNVRPTDINAGSVASVTAGNDANLPNHLYLRNEATSAGRTLIMDHWFLSGSQHVPDGY